MIPRGIEQVVIDKRVCRMPPWDADHLTLKEVAEFERLYREKLNSFSHLRPARYGELAARRPPGWHITMKAVPEDQPA